MACITCDNRRRIDFQELLLVVRDVFLHLYCTWSCCTRYWARSSRRYVPGVFTAALFLLPHSTIRNLFLARFQILIGSVNGRWVRTMSCIAEE
jgi:hypothetical protein